MKIEKTICPYCGASLKIRPGQKYVECEYCGSSSLITGTDRTASDHAASDRTASDRTASAADVSGAAHQADFRKPAAKKHALFPPPGFRRKNIPVNLAAAIGYLFLLLAAFNLGSPPDTIIFLIASLSVVDVCTDWTGVYSRLKGIHSPNTGVRIGMKIVWSAIIFTAWVTLLILIQQLTGM